MRVWPRLAVQVFTTSTEQNKTKSSGELPQRRSTCRRDCEPGGAQQVNAVQLHRMMDNVSVLNGFSRWAQRFYG